MADNWVSTGVGLVAISWQLRGNVNPDKWVKQAVLPSVVISDLKKYISTANINNLEWMFTYRKTAFYERFPTALVTRSLMEARISYTSAKFLHVNLIQHKIKLAVIPLSQF